MMKKKVFDIEGSNIENLGSEMEKECKKAAAGGEKAWTKAGKKPGIEIWRIEKFKVVPWDKQKYGQFFDGDSYICLYTYKKPDTDTLAWNLHFWLGTDTTRDEAGTAAYKTVELDDYLGGGPVQYREVCGKETDTFLNYFKSTGGVQLLSGGAASGFNIVKPEDYEPRLLHIKGRKNVRITQVPLKAASLSSGDAFILDNGLELYQFQGKACNQQEKVKAAKYVQSIRSGRKGKPTVTVVDQGDDVPKEFWELLGGEGTIRDDQGGDEAWETKCDKQMFQLTDAGGKLEFVAVARGSNVVKSKLNSDDVFVIDVGPCVYVWIGKESSKMEKKMGFGKAQTYLEEYKRPAWLPIIRVFEGSENQEFHDHMSAHKKAKKFQKSTGGTTVEQKGEMGCYLTFHETSNGTLFLNWKNENLPGALAYFKPKKKVSAFKFKKAGGKEELTRETNSKKKNLYEGWCNYVKLAKEYKSTVVYQTSSVYLYFHKGSVIEEVPRNVHVGLEDVEAVAAVPGSRKVFEGVQKIDRSSFLNKAQESGAALTLPK